MTDENKQLNKTQEIQDNSGSFSVSDVALFKGNPNLVYLYKKTEKLVSALYLLSSFISDKEPVKWQMREAGIELLSQGLSLSDRSSSESERTQAYTNFISTGLKFLSFLEVSYLGGIISEMNYNILKYEFESLIQAAEAKGKSNTGSFIFSENFFEVPVTPSALGDANSGSGERAKLTGGDKGQDALSDMTVRSSGVMSDKPKPAKQSHSSGDKSNRQEVIISLLKKNNELGIKDFTSNIKGCSEKTIQRELASLVSKGQIKKEGEKRWSRYSIKG